jgi:hypothetical protein
LFVHLRDREVESLLVESPKTTDEFYQTAAASEFLTWRSRCMEKMKQKGVLTMEAFPEELTATLINQYLEIKAGHLL